MSITPPVGFGLMSFTFQVAGGSHEQVNVFGFQNAGGLSAAGALSNFSAAMAAPTHIFDHAFYNDQYSLVQEYCLVNNGGVLFSDTVITAVVGLGGWDAPSPAVSGVVRKTTALAGRAFRGRFALAAGFLDEADIDSVGAMSGGFVTTLQLPINLALTATTTNNVPMYLLHGPNKAGVTPVPTKVTSLTLEQLTGTQRRRLRR